MSYEKRWAAIPSRALTANGTQDGKVTLASTIEFRVKQQVILTANSLVSLELEVKRVDSDLVMYVGRRGEAITDRTDISAYLTSDGAAIFALEQPRPSIPDKDYNRAMFEEEPVNAQRSILVDDFGNKYNKDNPVPVDIKAVDVGPISIGTDGFDPTDPDSMLATGSEDGTKTGVKHAIKVNNDGTIRQVQLFKKPFDAITGVNPDPDAVTEVYQSRLGGDVGTVQETATITYRDATKKRILKVVVT